MSGSERSGGMAIPSTSLLAAVHDIERQWNAMHGPIREAEHTEDGSVFSGDSYPRLHDAFAQMWHAIERAKKAANETLCNAQAESEG